MAVLDTPAAPAPRLDALRGVAIATGSIGLATVTTLAVYDFVGATPFALLHLAVLVSATLGGTRAGWLAVALAALAAVLVVVNPAGRPDTRLEALTAVGVSVAVACAIVVLVDRLRAREREAEGRRAELERVNRLYDALSQVNHAIVASSNRAELLERVCRALVDRGRFRMAWVGWHDAQARRLEPVASWGDSDGFLDGIFISTDERLEGRGPSGTAFREDRTYIANDFLGDASTVPWRAAALPRGFKASAAIPIRQGGSAVAVLAVYAAEPGYFGPREVALLEEAARDVAFGLDGFEREQERMRAEAAAARERALVDMMFDSVPGVVYLYDREGRFLRWNRSFLEESGYTADEVADMHPLAFFRGEDRDRVAARIAEVFERGSAAVEAGFVRRDGTVTPYLFTGRRVTLDDQPYLVGMGLNISDRVAAEERLRKSEERYHSTLDSILEGGQIIGFDWRYLYLNEAAARHNRRPSEELLGRTMQECWPGIEGTRAFAMIRECLENRVPLREEIDFRFPDGSSAWFDLRVQPIPEGAFLLSIDVTEQRRAEEEARALEVRFETVVEHLREGLVIADPARDLVYWNPAALAILGFDDPAVGRRDQHAFGHRFQLFDLDGRELPPDEWPLARVRRGETVLGLELRVQRRDRGPGWERIVSYAGARVTYGADRELAFITLHDVTQRKRGERAVLEAKRDLERKVDERTAELQAALVRAEAADRLKSSFLATMSHELRTPLNSIIGFTGIVLQGLAGPLSSEQAKQLTMVRGSARHLLELINDVLDISKIEAGQLEVRREPFDLRASVERAVEAIQPLADQKGLTVTTSVPEVLPTMHSDRRRVDQILLNLLTNAVKFTERGSIHVDVRAGDDVVTADGVPGVRVAVTDTGIGIRPEDLATLFQPFRQLDTGLSRQHEGTGLGLAICRRLARLLGGEVRATSTLGEGSEFSVILPVDPGG